MQKVKENQSLSRLLKGVRTGDVQQASGMQFLALYFPQGYGNYIFVDGAIKKEVLEIKEVSESGRVPELTAVNKGEMPILIPEGEELQGAKQNRTLNTSVLLPPKSSVVIPVSCVEQGRWNYKSRKFRPSDYWVGHKLRQQKDMDVSLNLKSKRLYQSNQNKVWSTVNEYISSANVRSRTSAYHDFAKEQKNLVDEVLEKIKPLPEQNGIAVFDNGRLMGVDFLGTAEKFEKVFRKILTSYAFDLKIKDNRQEDPFTVVKQMDFTAEELNGVWNKFTNDLLKCKYSANIPPGLGRDNRLEAKHSAGYVLCYEEKAVIGHLYPRKKKKDYITDFDDFIPRNFIF